ncbi:hypothetical protein X771_08420 [Mesorhizobium sp. LSJC277A00]|nr:hypothetical protein X771_08420 [Mesorhizobium sp. LSJC277A00]
MLENFFGPFLCHSLPFVGRKRLAFGRHVGKPVTIWASDVARWLIVGNAFEKTKGLTQVDRWSDRSLGNAGQDKLRKGNMKVAVVLAAVAKMFHLQSLQDPP